MKLNIYKERYCHKCHSIRPIKEFNKFLKTFAQSGVCAKCRGETVLPHNAVYKIDDLQDAK